MNSIELSLTDALFSKNVIFSELKFSRHHKYPCLQFYTNTIGDEQWWTISERFFIPLDKIININDIMLKHPEIIHMLNDIKIYNKRQKYALEEFKKKLSPDIQLLFEVARDNI